MKAWLWRVITWVSQTINLFLLFGHHNQTVSARAYVNRNRRIWKRVDKGINTVFFWCDNHTHEAFRSDMKYGQEVTQWYK